METTPAKRTRLEAEDRRMRLLDAAEKEFGDHGYARVGLAQIAREAGVSKTLLYHYFPGGRPEIYQTLMRRHSGELVMRLRSALRVPLTPHRRVERAIREFLAYLTDAPVSYRILFVEPWGSGEPELVGQAMAVHVDINAEFAQLFSGSAKPAETLSAAVAAALGSLIQVAEAHLSGEVGLETAIDVATAYVLGGLNHLGVVD